ATDAEVVELELMQVDLQTIERNIERVSKKVCIGDKDALAADAAFKKAKAHLEGDVPLRTAEFSEREHEDLKPLFLLTIKPVLFVANVGDDDLQGESEMIAELRAYAEKTKASVLHLGGDIEAELVRMDDEEREAFKADFGLKESGLTRLIHAGFDLLGLQTYFTAGEKEVRAWVIHKGDSAPVGAGVIHTDFLQKFIRAQVYSYEDLLEHRSEAAIKAAGRLRVEGKEYILQDGDICNFLIGN
ncbi:MAG: DUF933 domain-containing protein, partial [Planctomycetota bacterium]